jgi:F-type H+-transporting ATPase subunit a
MTLGLALVANLCWIYFIVKYAGIKAIIKDWFGNKAEKSEVSSRHFWFTWNHIPCGWSD